MQASQSSLVRYDNPILVSTTKDAKSKVLLAELCLSHCIDLGQGKKPIIEEKAHLTPTEDILNSILPPREWTEDGQLWVQYVSSTPATKSDVINLQEQLDLKLQQRQARETGICPIREELYAQCFGMYARTIAVFSGSSGADELIRQITINCAERGLLLLRVRDEIRMSISCFQTLYESSIAFGMRKALQAEQHKIEMQAQIKSLEAECRELDKQVLDMKHRCEAIEKKEADRRVEDAAKHREEVDFLRKHIQTLRKSLENQLAVPGLGGTEQPVVPGKTSLAALLTAST